MDLKRIITLLLAIVMCVNLLASAFPSVAYASGGEKQVEASDIHKKVREGFRMNMYNTELGAGPGKENGVSEL